MDRRAFLARARRSRVEAPVLPHATAHASLAPYTGPWDVREATHLIRRTHVGATRADVVSALIRGSAGAAATALVDAAKTRPLPDTPNWANNTTGNGGTNTDWLYQWQRGWYTEMVEGGLREKMLLFWHDHFATGHAVYYHAAFAVDYLNFLRERAVGELRPMVEGIGKLPAMLRFLDNDTNKVGDINENYGRELLELFSMGLVGPDGSDNYTQDDVRSAARALTGWVVNENQIRGEFKTSRYDPGVTTLFGVNVSALSGSASSYGYDEVIEVIFEHKAPAVAHFLASKLYAWFVHPVPNTGVVSALASELQSNNFDVGAAVQKLLSSAHFYDAAVVGARIKTPLELILGLTRELGIPASQDVLERTRTVTQSLGQEALNPPSVEGWPGYDDPLEYRAWITTGTIPERRGIADDAIYGGDGFDDFDPLPLIEQLSDLTDPYQIASDLAAHMLAPPMTEAATDELAAQTLLDGVPTSYDRAERKSFWVEIALTSENVARDRLRALLSHIVNLPEYQLV